MSVRSLFDVCDDKKPSGRHSCEEQKAWGKCKEEWFVRGNYCRKTCGKCVPFDPKTVDLKLAAAMRQCGLESKKTKDTCIAALKGESSELRIHSKLTSEESLSIEEVLESSSFFETMKACKVDCLVKSSSDNFVHALVENFLEKHPSKSKKLAEIFTADGISRIILDFFKYVGCSVEQFVAIIPKLYRILLEHNVSNDNDLLFKMYQIEVVDEDTNTTITYTSEYEGHPSVSTCLAKSLRTLLNSVRDCRDYHCYN